MNCEKFRSDIAAFLAGELDTRSSDEHRRHAEECAKCAAEMTSTAMLVDALKAHPDKDVPECVEARVLDALKPLRGKHNQQTPSPAPLLSRIQGAFTMKRLVITVSLVVVAIIVGLGIMPLSKENAVLAQVTRAMASVNSVHLTIASINTKTGERSEQEVWAKLPAKYRLRSESEDKADNGQKTISLQTYKGSTTATISRPEGLKGTGGHENLLVALFNFRELVQRSGKKILSQEAAILPDGRKATILKFASATITIDDATGRLEKAEGSTCGGHVRQVIEHIDYDQDMPDSMFDIPVPKGAVVIDTITPPVFSAKVDYERRTLAAKLKASGAWMIAHRNGVFTESYYSWSSGAVQSPAHDGMQFQALDVSGTWVYYIPARNSYYAIGRWLVTDEKMPGFKLVAQDNEFPAPRKPDIVPLPEPREDDNIGPGDTFGCFENLGSTPLRIIRKHSWKYGPLYEFRGKARHFPDGKVYENETVPAEVVDSPPMDVPFPAKLTWGNMTPDWIESTNAVIDWHNRVAEVLNNKNAKGYPVYQGAEVQEIGWVDDTVPYCDGQLQLFQLSREDCEKTGDKYATMRHVFRVPAKRIYLCIGHVKVKYPGKPDSICKNGVVSYEGDIVSSER